MKNLSFLIYVVAGLLASMASSRAEDKAIKALIVTGGCCHNYPFQTEALTSGITKMANVDWTIVNDGGRGTTAEIDLYSQPDWAKKFDVVIHNECFANTDSPDYIKRITKAHEAGVPAVVIHCAMHTYRAASLDEWRKFLGVTSRRHDHQSRYPVKVTAPEHPIMKGFPDDWVTPKDELYIIEKLWPNARALAESTSERDKKSHPVVWVNEYGKARVFGTTYGHSDETFRDPTFIQLVSRGLLWSVDQLDENGLPK